MGDTLDTLRAGSARLLYTVLIEGFEYILTNAELDAAVSAHAGSGHTGALGGLYVHLENEQRLSPWEPFGKGGRCTFSVVQTTAADTFGVATSRRNTGAETTLSVTADRNDGITVKSTADFPSSGDAHCGTECFSYSGKTSTTFTGVTRGKHGVFGAWGEHHRVGVIESSPKLEPLVTQYARTWIGRWVAVYAHVVRGGVLDTVSEAQLVFAGRLDSISDSPDGATVCEVKHVLDCIREHTIGRELWKGKLGAGVYIREGDSFSFQDHDGSTLEAANSLTAVVGASGTDEMEPGFYTHEQLQSTLNAWWQAEEFASRLHGKYTISASELDGGVRTKIFWSIPAASDNTTTYWKFFIPKHVAKFLGYSQAGPHTFTRVILGASDNANDEHLEAANETLKIFAVASAGPGTPSRAAIIEESGTFYDNYGTLPKAAKPPFGVLDSWGVFLIEDKLLIAAKKDGDELTYIAPLPYGLSGVQTEVNTVLDFTIDATVHNISTVNVRQIVMIETTLTKALKWFTYSTGTSGYNSVTWDTLPHGLGLGIPRDLLGSQFISACDHLPGAHAATLVVIDKPTRFVDIFAGDLMLRCAFLRWINGRLDMCQWRTPLAGHATIALTESNKARPRGDTDDLRATTYESSEWQRSIVKLLYNRDITQATRGEGYRSSLSLEDRVAIDDAGGEGRAIEIKCRNTYGQYAQTGEGVEQLAPGFLAIWPLFSRPVRLVNRTIDSKNFEGISIGDAVTVSDEHARDPETGERGISVRPAIVVRHWYTFGGRKPGSKTAGPMSGEVTLLLLDSDRVKQYGPAAELDETANSAGFTSGYNSGTNTIRCHAHKYSESTEAVDASYFAANYECAILEIDPADPDAPQVWSRTVASVSGNDIALSGSSLTGFDSSKRYRITFSVFGDGTEAQRTYAWQADDANGRIEDTAPAHHYGVGWPAFEYTANAASDPVELPPNRVSEDAASRDVAHDIALVRLLENLDDYKTAYSSPYLLSNVATHPIGSGHSGSWKLVMVRPIFLGAAGLRSAVRRELHVAPMLRSETGASVSIRVTLAAAFPTGSSVYDVDRGSQYDEATFTTSSTSWSIPSSQALDILSASAAAGVCWLLIEMTESAQTQGLSRCSEGPRIIA